MSITTEVSSLVDCPTCGSDRQLVICKNCGDEHYLDERKHRAASSFCPECRMRGGYVLDEYREEHKDKIRTDGGEEA